MINQIRICNNLLLVKEKRLEQHKYMDPIKLKHSVPTHIIDISTGNKMIIMDILK